VFLERRWRWRQRAVCVDERGFSSKNGEEGEVDGGRLIVPHDIPHVEAGSKAVGKTGIGVSEFRHLGLEFPVGHTCGIAVDDAEVGRGNFFCWEIAVGQRCIEHEASTGGVPLLSLVLFPRVLLLDVV
jgi:hypothetical protein